MRSRLFGMLTLTTAFVCNGQNQVGSVVHDPHNHAGRVHDVPWLTEAAPDIAFTILKSRPDGVRDSALSPNGQWLAFVSSTQDEWARLCIENTRNRERHQLTGLPLPHRPISDLVWIDTSRIAFDRWSQPHYGMHYVLDISRGRLVLAAPFPDAVTLRIPDSGITEKYWKLTELFGLVVPQPTFGKEAHMILTVNGNTIHGNAGCNSFAGTYVLKEGNQIAFSGIAATFMVCPDMGLESRFLEVLRTADTYVIRADTLVLSKFPDTRLASFESVYMK